MSTTTALYRELDHRISDGIEVRLLWRERDDAVRVAVTDARTGVSFCVDVRDDERAVDVFRHPFAYAARGRVERCEAA